jgi:glycopeptide antibiotics resistance protein
MMDFTKSEKLWRTKEGRIAITYSLFVMMTMFFPVTNIDFIPPEFNSDKVVHILLFAILYWSWLPAFKTRSKAKLISILISIGLGLFTEMVQSVLPYRNADPHDLAFDIAGVVSAYLIANIRVS